MQSIVDTEEWRNGGISGLRRSSGVSPSQSLGSGLGSRHKYTSTPFNCIPVHIYPYELLNRSNRFSETGYKVWLISQIVNVKVSMVINKSTENKIEDWEAGEHCYEDRNGVLSS
jgi:hypothetical protein